MDRFITISFSGKRVHPKLEDDIPSAMFRLFAALNLTFKNTNLHFVSGLADGADQLAAEVFISETWKDENSTNQISMGAVIAFRKQDYLKTIKHDGVFNRLFKICTNTLELDGVYQEGDDGKSKRTRAHRQQVKCLARIGDVLIAIAPKHDRGKAGGTHEAIVCALHMGKPVIFYNLDDDKFYYYRDTVCWNLDSEKAIDEYKIAALLRREFYDPDDVKNKAKDTIPSYELDVSTIDNKPGLILRLRKFAWEFFEGFFETPADEEQTGSDKKSRRLKKLIIKFWKVINGLFEKLFSRNNNVPKTEPDTDRKSVKDIIVLRREELSKITAKYQFHYRGGYMLNYMLASLAVLIAVVATCCYIYIPEGNPAHGDILIFLGAVKIALILLIIRNTKMINQHNYNKKAIEYRYVSERLRVNLNLAFAGIFKAVKPSLGNHNKNYLTSYSGEVLYEYILGGIFTERYALTLNTNELLKSIDKIKAAWYERQHIYHKEQMEKMKNIHDDLEKASEVMGVLVLIFVAFEIVLKLLKFTGCPHLMHFAEWFKPMSPAVLGLTTLLPALVLTAISLNYQTEAKRMSERSQKLINEIIKAGKDLDQTKIDLEQPERISEGSVFMELLTQLDKMGAIMTDEVAEWSLLYEKTVPET